MGIIPALNPPKVFDEAKPRFSARPVSGRLVGRQWKTRFSCRLCADETKIKMILDISHFNTRNLPCGKPPAAVVHTRRVLLVLALLFLLPETVSGQLLDWANRSSPNGETQGELSIAGDVAKREPGMIGGLGSFGYRPTGYPELTPAQQTAAIEEVTRPSDVGEWIAPRTGQAGGDFEYYYGDESSQYPPTLGYHGPVRNLIRGVGSLPHRLGGGADQGPVYRQGWLFNPASVGWFVGGISSGPLISGAVDQKGGFFTGYRMGWDLDDRWGYEMRFAFGWSELSYSYPEITEPPIGEHRKASNIFWGGSMLFYPWDDGFWRPYFSGGIAAARVDFLDHLSVRRNETVFAVPVAIGLKMRVRDRLVLRCELADDIAFGGEFETVHNLSITGGIEFRFGGTRVAYWPWNPGRHYQ